MSVKGVLRGLYFQKQYPQGKWRAIRGAVFDVAVDLRQFQNLWQMVWRGADCGEQEAVLYSGGLCSRLFSFV